MLKSIPESFFAAIPALLFALLAIYLLFSDSATVGPF